MPVLLWGPRDERPDEKGIRLRDSQCGLFATGKVLRRFGVPFTYLTNCRLEDEQFECGIRDFLAVCNVVKVFRHMRILQIGPWPISVAKETKGCPTVIIANTVKGFGSPVMENKKEWHHKVPTPEEYEAIIKDFAAGREAALS